MVSAQQGQVAAVGVVRAAMVMLAAAWAAVMRAQQGQVAAVGVVGAAVVGGAVVRTGGQGKAAATRLAPAAHPPASQARVVGVQGGLSGWGLVHPWEGNML